MTENMLISSSFVFDKHNTRFNILNIYNDDDDDETYESITHIANNNLELYNEKINKKIEKKEALKIAKCYCHIM